ncbi:MAG: HEPN domain-containing protein [Rikenellaceae bacterium]|nr:HEPN domain-containing protein [Rikenellaceae bacterium]
MLKSIKYLPEKDQENLKQVVSLILEELYGCERIILYGRWSRAGYRASAHPVQRADYELLILIAPGSSVEMTVRKLRKVRKRFLRGSAGGADLLLQAADILVFNRYLDESRYLYTCIKRDGIELYSSGQYRLARRRPVDYRAVGLLAQSYFDGKLATATGFMSGAAFHLGEGNYALALFSLHQSIESLYHTIHLVFTLVKPREHDLEQLIFRTRNLAPGIEQLFPRYGPDGERLFQLLRRAYIEARYNPEFTVSREDVETLLPLVRHIGETVAYVCREQIAAYRALAAGKSVGRRRDPGGGL